MTKLVALDAGHGINTAGKRTPDGEREWSFNNTVLLAAKKRLAQYEDVEVLRLDDPTGKTDVPLATRTNKANKAKASVVVSIHHNANTGKWGDWTGTETFVMAPAANNPSSMKLAKSVHPKLVKAMGLRDRGIKSADFHMLRETYYTEDKKTIGIPAILTEGGYMDSKNDIKALRSVDHLEAAGKAIADGVADYLGLKLKKEPVKPSKPAVSKPKPVEVPGKDEHIHRVIVDGKQVGAYGVAKSVGDAVEKAVANGAKKVEVERV